MLKKIKNKVEKELNKYVHDLDRQYSLSKISPLLFKSIKDFVLRKGKRVRPILFIIGYLGFKKRPAKNLYTCALSLELLHDFMLAHDDIIDKSDTRRGKPSLHKMLGNYLKTFKKLKFNGSDLAIVIADVMYALAIHTFLSIKEQEKRKERALKKFIEAAIYTGSGEFIEILNGVKDIEKTNKTDIYKIYDLKTAHYTFATPLSTGAMLAGANQGQIDNLFKFGIYLGRAFQIKDDILGMFGQEKRIGKSAISDLQEAKKTLLIWYAYNHSSRTDKLVIKKIFGKEKVSGNDLFKVRKIITESRALDYTKREISRLINKALYFNSSSRMDKRYKHWLRNYSQEILSV